MADEGHGAYDTDALLPDCAAVPRHVVKQRAVLVQQPFAEEWIATEVYEVPVVDAVCVREVKVDALALKCLILLCMSKDFHKGQESGQTYLVKFA